MKTIKLFFLIAAIAAVVGMATSVFANETAPTNSTEAVLHFKGFREALVWIGQEPSEQESGQLLEILKATKNPGWQFALEKFLNDHPDSPWAVSLHNAFASFCHRTGRTTKALEHWEAAWNLVKDDTSTKGRRLGGTILANWMQQLSSLGRHEKLKELIAVGDKWPFGNHQDLEKFEAAENAYHLMGAHPEMSFRCGTLALKAVGQYLQPTNHSLESLVDIPSPTNGFSVGALAVMSDHYGLDLVAMRRTNGRELIVPSIVHWRQNHYAAIVGRTNENYQVIDPTFGKPKWMPAEVINEESSGIFLVPASLHKDGWTCLANSELARVHGMGLPANANDGKDKGCITMAGGAKLCPCPGMPVWWVSEPYINVWMADEPLTYLTSRGEPFPLRITYKQRDTRSENLGYTALTAWNIGWSSYLIVDSTVTGTFGEIPDFNHSDVALFLPDGGEVDFPMPSTFGARRYDPETRLELQLANTNLTLANTWLPNTDSGNNGLRLIHADGSQDIYAYGVGNVWVDGDYPQATYMRSRHIDPNGNTSWFYFTAFSEQYAVTSAVDYDGKTNTLTYTTSGEDVRLASVTNAYGDSASFSYDSSGNLSGITDAQGLSSTISYDTNGYPTNLITPYGTNTFTLFVNSEVANTNNGEGNFGGDHIVDRAAQITDPTGGTHLYLYQYDCSSFMATNYSASSTPTNTPLGTLDAGTSGTNSLCGICYRNSFAWDARQYLALSTNSFTNLTANDYLRGRMRHWLQDTNVTITISGQLSVEEAASPDGSNGGLLTFYDYQGKTQNYIVGTNPLPSVIAWQIPGQDTHYESDQYDYFGNITNRTTTYTTSTGAIGTRSDQFIYTDNTYTNVNGVLDGNGNIFDTLTNTFTVPNLLTQIVAANGSNVWTFSGFDAVTWTEDFYILDGTNIIQTNQELLSSSRVLPDSVADGVNETTTLSFTGFNKIQSIQWPSGLTTTNIYYTNGFLAQSVDLQINRTNGFAYSTNGLPSTFTNELGLVVNLTWDNLLRLTGASFPDGTTASNVYYRLDRSARKDRLGNWTYFGYDGLRHLTSVTNANSKVTSYGWCDCGALTSITDALTNTITRNYDYQSRLTNVLFPDSSSLIYLYDLSGQRTNIADGSGAAANLAYNNQGLPTNISNLYGPVDQAMFDILDRPDSFTDANNVTFTNGYDMLNRLLVRTWSVDGNAESFLYATNGLVAFTNRDNQVTRFLRDAAGRLTARTNANLEVAQFAFDPSSDLTTLIDGLQHSNIWKFDQYGRPTNKVDASNNVAFVWSWNANGWLTNRWMPASGNTQYKFDAVGNLTNVVYSNSTTVPVTYIYDADNRLVTMIDAIGTTTWTYTSDGQVASEAGPWTSNTVSYTYNQGHRASLTLLQPTGGAWTQTYSYDNAWRLTGLTSPAGSFAYSYPASASQLVLGITLPNAAYITNQYDSLARLTNTSLVNYWGHVLDGYGYAYDPLGLRTNISRYLGITTNNIAASYDNIAQLIAWSGQDGLIYFPNAIWMSCAKSIS